ncbi:MAG: ABC transporter ATP-binding protein [Flavobacteriales bacterium]|nr:ABC transporter ATP-binding protein [Flavobacteriales bacterium]
MIKSTGLTFQYYPTTKFRFPDIECQFGEHLLLLGESGKGKTTLLHLLAGMLQPSAGNIFIGDIETSALSGAEQDKFRGKNIGIVFQTPHFVESLSVEDNLILPQFLTGNTINRKKAREVMDRLRLGNMMHKKPSTLSAGEQQRVAIGRAIMNEPVIILADEPTSALDDHNAEEVIKLLEEQAKSANASLLIVTHDKRLKDRFPKSIQI